MMQPVHHPTMSPVTALDSSSGTGGASSSTGDTTISANDFLTLLVAEMKNQDPTADTDPNAYIDQLVQVNSLQQLIQINQDLGGSSSTTSASSNSGSDSSRAISAASRLATSLARKHPQSAVAGATQPGAAENTGNAARAAQNFKSMIHQS